MLKFKVLKNEKVIDFIYCDTSRQALAQLRKIINSIDNLDNYRMECDDNYFMGYVLKDENIFMCYTLQAFNGKVSIKDPLHYKEVIAFNRYINICNRYEYISKSLAYKLNQRKAKTYVADTFENIDSIEKAHINLLYCNIQNSLFLLQMKDTFDSEDYALSDKYNAQLREIRQNYIAEYGFLPICDGLNTFEEMQNLRKNLSNIVKA